MKIMEKFKELPLYLKITFAFWGPALLIWVGCMVIDTVAAVVK